MKIKKLFDCYYPREGNRTNAPLRVFECIDSPGRILVALPLDANPELIKEYAIVCFRDETTRKLKMALDIDQEIDL